MGIVGYFYCFHTWLISTCSGLGVGVGFLVANDVLSSSHWTRFVLIRAMERKSIIPESNMTKFLDLFCLAFFQARHPRSEYETDCRWFKVSQVEQGCRRPSLNRLRRLLIFLGGPEVALTIVESFQTQQPASVVPSYISSWWYLSVFCTVGRLSHSVSNK